jgi:hypothetical protein
MCYVKIFDLSSPVNNSLLTENNAVKCPRNYTSPDDIVSVTRFIVLKNLCRNMKCMKELTVNLFLGLLNITTTLILSTICRQSHFQEIVLQFKGSI